MEIRDYSAPTFYRSQYQNTGPKSSQVSFHIEHNVLTKDEITFIKSIIDNNKHLLKPMTLAPNGSDVSMNFLSFSIGRVEEFQAIDNKILSKLIEINDKYFRVHIDSRDFTNCNLYNKNQYIEWHADDVLLPYALEGELPSNQIYRKLSSTLSLTDHEEYEGGNFQIMSFKENPNKCLYDIRLEIGSLIVFPAFMMHKVTPITKGSRLTLIHRLNGARWQ